MKRHHPSDDHWYLAMLGTEPAQQGRGVGSAVLEPVLERADLDGVGAYLESSNPVNLAFYERHSFRPTGTLDPGGCPPLTTMWRDPQPVGTGAP
jgi:ribosomal protein S18 acetylase RimI-like enzyme